MKKTKSLLFALCSLLCAGSAGAVVPIVAGLLAGGVAVAGFSIYQSMFPVDLADAMSFFGSCWSCGLFGSIMETMSGILPRVYKAIGAVIMPTAGILTGIWFAWSILAGYIGIDKERQPWDLASDFGTKILKLGLVLGLIAIPLPRLITNIAIEPIFNVGLAANHAFRTNDSFETCLVATAVSEPADPHGAFSPKLQHNLSCQLANVHQMTALGMTTGWTMLNMSFDAKYMHKILWDIPLFPNFLMLIGGIVLLWLFFMALLPIPLYFLQMFFELALALIMLPLWLLGWLFEKWKVFPQGKENLQKTIDRVIQNTCGIALVGLFVSFSSLFLSQVFNGNSLAAAFAANDSKMLMDGLMLKNDSIITIILLGLFLAMFMNIIPKLIESLFAKVKIPAQYYETAKKDIMSLHKNAMNWYKSVRK